jgi:hypothetical protein
MNTNPTPKQKSKPKLSTVEFALLGGGQVAYVRELSGEQARDMFSDLENVADEARLFGVYAADGTCMAITDSRAAAVANAFEHDLHPLSVH